MRVEEVVARFQRVEEGLEVVDAAVARGFEPRDPLD